MTDPSSEQPQPPSSAPTLPKWALPTITGVAGLVIGLVVGSVGLGAVNTAQVQAAEEEASAEAAAEGSALAIVFRDALRECEGESPYALTSDKGRTLTIDNKGDDDFDGLHSDNMWCIVQALGAPAAVISHMEQTTSMDGRQTESWDNIEVSWSRTTLIAGWTASGRSPIDPDGRRPDRDEIGVAELWHRCLPRLQGFAYSKRVR